MDRLMLLEQTTPKESLEVGLMESGGGIPGGVMGLGSLIGTIPVTGAIVIYIRYCSYMLVRERRKGGGVLETATEQWPSRWPMREM